MTEENPSPPEPAEHECPGDDTFRPLACGRDETHARHPLGLPPTGRTLRNVERQGRVIE